jgi:predicted nucleotidyltransferase
MAQAQPPQALDLEHLRSLAEIVAKASGAVKVVLFGSRARADDHENSDVDFLLLVPDEAWSDALFECMEPALRAQDALWDAGARLRFDLIPMRLTAFEREASVLARVVKREGIVVFDSTRAVETRG